MITPIPEKQQEAQLVYSPRFFSLHTDLEGLCVSSNELFKDRFYTGISHSFSQCFINSISPQCINKFREAIKECIAQRTTIAIDLQHQAFVAGTLCYLLGAVPGAG